MSGYIFGRRVRFALIVLASQILLIALAFTWIIQMSLIALKGSVRFVENNLLVLIAEIIVSILICVFGTIVFVIQWKRLGEKRMSDVEDRRIRR